MRRYEGSKGRGGFGARSLKLSRGRGRKRDGGGRGTRIDDVLQWWKIKGLDVRASDALPKQRSGNSPRESRQRRGDWRGGCGGIGSLRHRKSQVGIDVGIQQGKNLAKNEGTHVRRNCE